ncbi:MAG: TetR/AcrR family transcriptional regulator [Caulobacteraceae bacterium]
MDTNELDARDRIMKATMEILDEEQDTGKITVRKIAERAGVGTGLINYHFQSKEKLLYETVNVTMTQMAEEFRSVGKTNEMEPVEFIKYMLKKLSEFAVRYKKLTQISVSYALLQGEMDAEMYLLPALKTYYGRSRDENELRLIAFTLIKTMQVIYLRADAFLKYSGIDVTDEEQRNESIDLLVTSILKK